MYIQVLQKITLVFRNSLFYKQQFNFASDQVMVEKMIYKFPPKSFFIHVLFKETWESKQFLTVTTCKNYVVDIKYLWGRILR